MDQSCNFSVRTQHRGTSQPKLRILIYIQDQYLRTISNVNLLPTAQIKFDISIGSQTRITTEGDMLQD